VARAGATDGAAVGYEQLRQLVLEDSHTAHRELGFTLFMRRGMAAWIDAWWQCALRSSAKQRTEPDAVTVLPAGLRSEVATVLVAMALGSRRSEART